MATNNFKPFATGSGANVTSQADWEALAALATGFQSGKANSAQMNKALRQSSFIAAALAQFVADKSGKDVLDDGDLAGFVAKLIAGFGNQYLSRTSPFSDIKTDNTVSAALSNLGLGGDALMEASGYIRLSPVLYQSKLITPLLQWMMVSADNTGTVRFNWPLPFATKILFGIANERQPGDWTSSNVTAWGFDSVNSTLTQAVARVRTVRVSSVSAETANGFIVALGY